MSETRIIVTARVSVVNKTLPSLLSRCTSRNVSAGVTLLPQSAANPVEKGQEREGEGGDASSSDSILVQRRRQQAESAPFAYLKH